MPLIFIFLSCFLWLWYRPWPKEIWGGKGLFDLHFLSQCITEETQERKASRDLEAGTETEPTEKCHLPNCFPWLALPVLLYIARPYVKGWHGSHRSGPPTSTITQSDGDVSSVVLPSSQMTKFVSSWQKPNQYIIRFLLSIVYVFVYAKYPFLCLCIYVSVI